MSAGGSEQEFFATLWTSSRCLGIALTLLAYAAACALHRAMGGPAALHPLLLAIVAVTVCLWLLDIPYALYFESAEPLHLLLGPVVVMLAVPFWRQLGAIAAVGLRIVPVLVCGVLMGVATSAGLAMALGADQTLIATLAPRSVTTPVAIGLSDMLGGIPAITALTVILAGLVGTCIGWPLLLALGVRDPRAQGLAIGMGAHAIGTARSFQIDATAGAFAALGMILNALATAGLLGLWALALG